MYWLDLVRYADSGGYHSDNDRTVWLYRDYVINAFKVAREVGMGGRINTIMQVCFFALAKVLPLDVALEGAQRMAARSSRVSPEERSNQRTDSSSRVSRRQNDRR